MSGTLDDLVFDNRFTSELPADPSDVNRPRQVQSAAFSSVAPTPTDDPKIVAVSTEMAEALELSGEATESEQFARVFSGNDVLPGMDVHAMVYGGHQFGNWAGQLGDGRAMGLGEVRTSAGEHFSLQLKGAGPTPFSRSADGRAVLRSSVREFLCSEAMHHLGVPTTRALSLVTTGTDVLRDMLYDGNPAMEPGAVVCRVAPSFIRFGSFELPASRGDVDLLRKLADFTIRTYQPELIGPDGKIDDQVYLAWFRSVVERTVDMVIHWMRVGFVHGVMNTDNMSIHGLTIDYGPYGWLEDYDPDWTPNTTDAAQRRYRYGFQPRICHWNLMQLANAIHPLIESTEDLQAALDVFVDRYQQQWGDTMGAKLGLPGFGEDDAAFLDDLHNMLRLVETDMTIFYRRLADLPAALAGTDAEVIAPLADAYYVPEQLTDDIVAQIASWVRAYQERLTASGISDADRRTAMNAVNPKYVLRNYLAQLAIDKAEQGDNVLVNELLQVLRNPYDEQPDFEDYAAKRPDWARTRVGCSQLSCSS